ncbi:39874_t:CDS:2 [Gigaspora margarita]|uniref:39874_t:CDS:1 n=1 Tax=Gigaspora margarita TaxID=4874 RepID=A0ABN7VR36_GIGMA|nr:39874_t:CDS:2 [Gigaspora margarita]
MPRISIERRSKIHALICEAKKVGSVKNLPKSGCSQVLTEQDERNAICLLASGECSNAVEIQKKIKIGHKIETRISDPDELWEVIQKVWADMDIVYLGKLIKSMPQHVLDVYKAGGDYTEW